MMAKPVTATTSTNSPQPPPGARRNPRPASNTIFGNRRRNAPAPSKCTARLNLWRTVFS